MILHFSDNTQPSAIYRTNVHLLRNSSVSERAPPPTQLSASSFSNLEIERVRFFLGHTRDGTQGLVLPGKCSHTVYPRLTRAVLNGKSGVTHSLCKQETLSLSSAPV